MTSTKGDLVESIRKRLTYANVMSSLAVFLLLGGGAAFAAVNLPARSVGSQQLQPNAVKTGYLAKNAVRTGKVAFEAIRAGKLSKNAVPTNRLRDSAVTGAKIRNGTIVTDDLADDAVTGAKLKESTLGTVPDASKFAGHGPDAYVGRGELLWAAVDENGDLAGGSGAVSATRLGTGTFRVGFNRPVNGCVSEGTATDISGGAAPSASAARIVGTDNRVQADTSTVDVTLTNPEGNLADPIGDDGFIVTVYC